MEINRCGVLERFVLLVRRRDDVRMTMPHADRANAAEAVQITFPGFIVEVLHLSLDRHERVFVEQENSLIEDRLASRQQFRL